MIITHKRGRIIIGSAKAIKDDAGLDEILTAVKNGVCAGNTGSDEYHAAPPLYALLA